MSFTINQLRDFSSLFTRSEVCRWLKGDFNSLDVKLNRYDCFEKHQGRTYLKILKDAYKILEENYPNEYIIKNEFLNQWLKEELLEQNSIIFNELRVGKAIADLAMFNGTSKVFEIKTIFDKEYRLSRQLHEYGKLFNETYIIIPKVHLLKYLNYNESIGVISYEANSKKFFLEKKPLQNYSIDVNTLMEVLHTKEYINIARGYCKEFPEINAFNQFNICKSIISEIPYEELHRLFLEVMKRRKVNNLFFNKRNSEFNQICLSLNLKESERKSLIKNLESKIL